MLDIDGRRLTDALQRIIGVCDDLGLIAKQTSDETLGHAVVGLMRNVYSTEPGAYVRTHDLMRATYSAPRSTTNTASVKVWNTAPYALYVELGQGPNGLTLPQDQAYSAANPDPQLPVSFGRSGRRYTIAGPFIAPAQYFAAWRLGRLFGERVQRAAR